MKRLDRLFAKAKATLEEQREQIFCVLITLTDCGNYNARYYANKGDQLTGGYLNGVFWDADEAVKAVKKLPLIKDCRIVVLDYA